MDQQKLSSLERYFYLRSSLNLHSCFYIGIQLNKLPDRTQLQHAIKSITGKYTQLHCNVATDDEDGKSFLQTFDASIQFDDVVEFVDWETFDQDKINYVFQNYAFTYNVEKPLWKILIIPSERKLVLVMSHVLFDGMSGVLIWKEFLKNLNQNPIPINTDSDKVYVPSESPGFVADHHPYEDWPGTWRSRIARFFTSLYLTWRPLNVEPGADQFHFTNYSYPDGLLKERKNPITGLYHVRNDNLQWNLHLSPEELQIFLSLCKRHKVSLNSFLTALFTQGLVRCTDPKKYEGSQVKICVPINTRSACNKFLQNDQYTDQLGNFVAAITLTHNIKDEMTIWQLAEKYQAITAQMARDRIPDAINECKLLDLIDVQQFLEAKVAASKPGGTFEVSNLGYQSFDDSNGPFVVEDAFFNQPQGISEEFFCSVISTKGGLNCTVSYPKDLETDLEPCLEYVRNWVCEVAEK